jgi:hypothetical protein
MTEDNDLRDLWQSQPAGSGLDVRVPQFGLLEDLTVPVFAPLSPWRRGSYAAWAVGVAGLAWRDRHGPGTLHAVLVWMVFAAAVAGIVFALAQRDRSPDPKPEETLVAYRKAMRAEFDRQFRIERSILVLLCGASVAGSCLAPLAVLLGNAPMRYHDIPGLVAVIVLILWGRRMYNRAARAARENLQSEIDAGE